jgi:hypothetical protein
LNAEDEEIFLENQEFIDVTVDPDMKPLLLQLREQGGFTFYELKNIIKLGAYSVRIYELLKQYQKIGQRKIRVNELMRMLELTTEYPLFANFYQKIVNPSIREINKHTDLIVETPQKIKKGRKVIALLFTFRKKDGSMPIATPTVEEAETAYEVITTSTPPPTILGATAVVTPKPIEVVPPTPKEKPLVQEAAPTPSLSDELFGLYHTIVVLEFGVSPSVFMKILDHCTKAQVEKAIRVTQRAKKENKVKSIPGFFVEAIRNNFTDLEEQRIEQQRAEEAQKAALHKELQVESDQLIAFIIQQEDSIITKLTSKDPSLNLRAIENAKVAFANSPSLQKDAQERNIDLHTVTTEDWHQKLLLKVQRIQGIKRLEYKAFAHLDPLIHRAAEIGRELKM